MLHRSAPVCSLTLSSWTGSPQSSDVRQQHQDVVCECMELHRVMQLHMLVVSLLAEGAHIVFKPSSLTHLHLLVVGI